VVCAWCHKLLEPGAGADDADVSHGICKACSRFFLEEAHAAKTLVMFLEDLPVPVLVIDGGGEVLAANRGARNLSGLSRQALPGLRSGDVIACANARLPEGCGRTENCLGCVVRQSVEDTYTSGEPREQVTDLKQVSTPSGVRRARFRIATRKHGDAVLLRIDEVDSAA
jgi:PAS domain-containing protein